MMGERRLSGGGNIADIPRCLCVFYRSILPNVIDGKESVERCYRENSSDPMMTMAHGRDQPSMALAEG